MAPLTIQLLGTPEIRHGQQPVPFRTRKVLALLVYLVVERGMHRRESLIALLWPESTSDSGAATLRVTLTRLRHALQPAGDFLITEAGKVGFDSRCTFDLDLDWLAVAVRPETPADHLTAVHVLDRGDFLEGFSLPDAPTFDTWASIQREACRRRLETVYDRLSQHQLATHSTAAAVESTARWVARDPLNEQAHRRLMAAQALSGHRLAALQTYERLRATLQQELGLEPSRETAVLADNIGRGHVGEERPGPSFVAGSGPTGAKGQRLTLPLVGRSDEHSRLVAAFRRAGREGVQVVALIGAAGVGKTRLVSAFQEWLLLDEPQSEVWQGRAFEAGGRLAYQPVVDALRPRLEQVNAPEDLLDDVWLAELSQLMPELRSRYPDLPPPMTGDAHFVRSRIFEALANLGDALAARRPAVFVLDDMQWADADTLDLVHYLARRWSESRAPILLLPAIRQEAFAANAALRDWLTGLGRDAPLTRLLLDNLSGAAVEQLVTHLAGEKIDGTATAFAAWLWAETRGLPFFIEALLQMLIEQGNLLVTDQGRPTYDFAPALAHVRSMARVPLPPGVREVIQARLTQHSKEAGALLLAAAVLGRACTFERMCQVANLSETDALEALEALLDGRLVTERPADRRPYTPAHDYIREVVYSESNEARRRVYHRRALLALEAGNAPAAECAFHALAALLDEPAFRFSLAAGDEAFASYAVQEALAHFDTAREVVRRMLAGGHTVDGQALSRLCRQRGQALELIQNDEAAQANYDEMLELAVRRRDQALELAALISLGTLHGSYTGVFNPPKARESALKALAQARDLGDRQAEAGVLWALTVIEFFGAGDSSLIMEYGRQALALARELGLKEILGGTLNILCWPLVGQKQLERALEALTEAQLVWRELGNLPRLGEASRFMLIIHFIAGDNRRLLLASEQLAALGVFSGSRLDQLNAIVWLANVNTRQGRFAQALDYLEESAVLCADIGYSNEQQGHEIGRIILYLAAGALDEAERSADSLYTQRAAIMPSFTHFYLTHVVRVKIACGRLDEGQALLDELLPTAPIDAPGSHMITLMAIAYGELNLARGRPADLFAGLEGRARPYREAGFGYYLADELWLRGRAELALGRLDAARAALLQAGETAAAQEERAILWKILASLADVEEACGDTAAAGRLRDQARVVVDYIAAHAGELRDAFLGQPAITQLLSKT
jgi:DNA-binding SARP family transcriptional activator